jgi:hypothetical protein
MCPRGAQSCFPASFGPPSGSPPPSGGVCTVHVPLRHAEPAPHAFPHVPQLFLSALRLVHVPLQEVVGEGQPHWPFAHAVPPVHAIPQPPQLFGSFLVSMQAPAQSRSGLEHEAEHALLLHT